jgi:predicted sugar kinase
MKYNMAKRVIISAPGRLHFNSLKMNSFGGRGCGGIGLSLTRPRMTLIFDRAPEIIIVGANKQLRKKIENCPRGS